MSLFFDRETVESEARAAWAANPALRAEFVDNQASFVAYRVAVAKGQVKERSTAGSSAATAISASAPGAGVQSREAAIRRNAQVAWDANAGTIRAEFGSLDAYIAWALGGTSPGRAAEPGASLGQQSERFIALQRRLVIQQRADQPATFEAWLSAADPGDPSMSRRAYLMSLGLTEHELRVRV